MTYFQYLCVSTVANVKTFVRRKQSKKLMTENYNRKLNYFKLSIS